MGSALVLSTLRANSRLWQARLSHLSGRLDEAVLAYTFCRRPVGNIPDRNLFLLGREPTDVSARGQAAAEAENAKTWVGNEAAVEEYYSGKNEALRPIHEAVMKRIEKLGEFEIAPKKKYLSLRRKKQFAMVGPGSKGRVEIGLNMKDVQGTDRLESLPPGGMCQYRVFLHEPSDVNDELMAWVKTAFESAG